MNELKNNKKLQLGMVLLLLLAAAVWGLLNWRMTVLLQQHTIRQMEENVRVLANEINAKLDAELEALQIIAAYYAKETIDKEAMFEVMKQDEKDSQMGLLTIDGKALYGEPYTGNDFRGIQNSFRGYPSVSFEKDKGMLFSVPVYHGGNVRYVLYKLIHEDKLDLIKEDLFFGEDGQVLLADQSGQIIIPYKEWNEEAYMADFHSEKLQDIFAQINRKMNISTAAVVYGKTDDGRFYIFQAEVHDKNLLIVGSVPQRILWREIGYISMLVFWVFGLMVVLFCVFLYYMVITTQKAKESDALRSAKESAELANHTKTIFLANMSHEIKTPINAIMGMNEMIKRESKSVEILHYSLQISNALNLLESILNNLLDLAKIEAGKMEIKNASYELGNAITDAINLTILKADNKGLLMQIEADETTPNHLFGDETHIKQILINLINNAIKYTGKGKITIKVSYERYSDSQIDLIIAVKDTGIGIKEEDQTKLYEEFERLEVQKHHSVEGSGLGLTIVHQLIDMMNGVIEVESTYGIGSTFTVRIPQKVKGMSTIGLINIETIRESRIRQDKYRKTFVAPKARVLIVDDNQMNSYIISCLLKENRMQITTCNSGKAALDILQKHVFDIVLLDHMMPEMDGIETLQRIREMEDAPCQNVPVIAMTANVWRGAKEQYLSYGFTDYIGKPIDGTELSGLLEKHLPVSMVREIWIENMLTDENMEEITYLMKDNAMKYCAGSESLYRDFLIIFLEESGEQILACKEEYKRKNWENYTIVVHGIKSTAYNIGGDKLGNCAKILEKMGKEIQTGDQVTEKMIKEKHEELLFLYQKTYEAIEQILSIP